MIWVVLTACTDPSGGADDSAVTGDSGEVIDDSGSTWVGRPQQGPLARDLDFPRDVDVVVIGSGPAGMAAALTAREFGATVAVLDRGDTAGVGILSGSRCFAAGTSYQKEAGIVDSAVQAIAEWDDFAGGGSTSPGVTNFVERSAETLDWVLSFGAELQGIGFDYDAGTVARMHTFALQDSPPALVRAFDGELVLNANVVAPLLQRGRISGVVWIDTISGEKHVLRAGSVVVATGGFARNMDLVNSLLPDLAGRGALVEANLSADGGGIPFLDLVGAGWSERERLGVYVHGVADPVVGEPESLIGSGFDASLLVDSAGARFGNEEQYYTFDFYSSAPADTIWSVFTTTQSSTIRFTRPAYNVGGDVPGATMYVDELLAAGGEVFSASGPEALAEAAGIDATGLLDTIHSWNDTVEKGGVDPFGRDLTDGPTMGGDTWYAVRVRPAVGKAFGGVATSVDGEVLDPSGAAIPGLYAAGEVAGMVLGGGAHGMFSGSVCACYHGGRVAGGAAAKAAR